MKRLATRVFLFIILAGALTSPTIAFAQNLTFPDIQLRIPGVDKVFTDATKGPCPGEADNEAFDGCLQFPWIGQYISHLYVFAVYAATVLAAVVIMVAGFLWLTAGGNAGMITTARGYLSGALLGLFLMLSSYTILRLVNPDLVVFSSLSIPYIRHVDLATFVKEVETGPNAASITRCNLNGGSLSQLSNTDLAPDLQSYFNEAAVRYDGISPAFLAALAAQETRGRFFSDQTSSAGATGLMQIVPGTASDIWDRYSEGFVTRPNPECSGANDPRGKSNFPPSCATWMQTHNREVILMAASYVKNYIQPQLTKCAPQYSQNLTLVAAAYNHGPGKRSGAICGGQVPNVKETQDYAKEVEGYNIKYCSQSGGVPVFNEDGSLNQREREF